MALTIADRVRETTTTTGTGTVTLAGAASGYRTFTSVVATGDQCNYVIALGAEWEVGVGTMASTTTLARTVVLASSNAGALVNFSAGTKDVFLTQPAALMDSMLQRDRNLLHNGAMNVCQRATSVAGVSTDGGQRTVDRWVFRNNALGVSTFSQTVDAPAGTGLIKCYKALCTTGETPVGVNDYLLFQINSEGQDFQRLLWGTALAKPVTLSFWVKANITGTFIAELYRTEGTSRHVGATFTIASASTWEYKTITFAGDQTTAITNDVATRVSVNIWLGTGTSFSSGALQTAWGNADNTKRAAGCTSLNATTNNYIEFTGVQLEVGSIATPFEHRPYDEELFRCMRYFRQTDKSASLHGEGGMYGYAGVNHLVLINLPFPVPMRAVPTSAVLGTFVQNNCTGPVLLPNISSYYMYYQVTALGQFSAYSNNSGYLTFNAEI